MLGVVVGEEHPADHGVHIQQQCPDQQETQRSGKALADGHDHDPQLGQETRRARHPGQPEQPQHGGVLTGERQESHGDDEQVEHVPRIAEEVLGAVGVGGGPQQDLGGERGEEGKLCGVKDAVPFVHDAGVGFDAQQRGVARDKAEDGGGERRRVHDAAAVVGQGVP
ncbi:hypothetical protein AQJ91_34145 [Streptomyces dysideae]|uniref:Uncharacterized protein n=1 Tax=Streptomyces dysideae TaxID=909626 RepID=A0A117RYP1_9ACTN|nr:hypothetical protein AQJ91_34145 [Streptomyces dysideae]